MDAEKIRPSILAAEESQSSPRLSTSSLPADSSTEGLEPTDANTGRWTRIEHKRFLEALKIFGKNWKKVQEYVGSRTTTQARSHAQKYFAKLDRLGSIDIPLSELPAPVIDLNDQESLSPASPSKVKISLTSCPSPPIEGKSKQKRRLKGPYSPGKRPIRCDPPTHMDSPMELGARLQEETREEAHAGPQEELQAEAKMSDTMSPRKKSKKEQPIESGLLKLVDDPLELDKSVHLRPDFPSFLPPHEPNAWNDKSLLSEPDFEVAPVETIKPLELDNPGKAMAMSLDVGIDTENKSTGVDFSAGVVDLIDRNRVGAGK